jgi:hypothetical protein
MSHPVLKIEGAIRLLPALDVATLNSDLPLARLASSGRRKLEGPFRSGKLDLVVASSYTKKDSSEIIGTSKVVRWCLEHVYIKNPTQK